MKPRPHQSAAIDFAIDAFSKGPIKCLAQMPTGSGKSLVKLYVAQDTITRGRKVVLLSPSSATVGKLYLDAKALGLRPGVEMNELRAPVSSRLVIGTYHTAWRRIQSHYERGALLILDETHHVNAFAPANVSIYRRFDSIFGVSASPWSKSCEAMFDRVHVYPLSQSIKDGVNCQYELLEHAPISPGKYQMVYCPTNYTVKEVAGSIGHSDWVLCDREDRNEIISLFIQGRVGTMVVNRMLTEGFDLPPIKNVWITRDCTSPIFVYQMLGRALRYFQNQTARCYLMHWNARKNLADALTRAG